MSYSEQYGGTGDDVNWDNSAGSSSWSSNASNASSWTDFSNEPLPDHIRYFGLAIGCIICGIGLFGNILLCVAVVVNKTLRTTANSFIFSLAVSDIIKLSVFIPLNIHTFRVGDWQFGGIGCLVQVFDFSFVSLVVTFHVVIITFCRYLIIVWPKIYMKVSGLKTVIVVFVLVYLVPLGLVARRLASAIRGGYTMNVDVFFIHSALVCVFVGESGSIMSVVYGILAIFCVILYLYGHIWFTVRQSSRALHNHDAGKPTKKGDPANNEKPTKGNPPNNGKSTKGDPANNGKAAKPKATSGMKREMKLAQSMVVVMVIFLATTLPGPVIYQISTTGVTVPSEVYVVGILLSWSFHCSNWLVYGFMNRQFRGTYLNILKGRLSNNKVTVISVTERTNKY